MTNLKLALVTGASRGIGQAIAQSISEDFYTIGTATSQKGADAISSYLGDRGEGRVLNVTDSEAAKDFISDIEKNKGSISVLVNNAGITRDGLSMRMSQVEWDDVLNTNLSAVFRLSQFVMRGMMKARWGRIINIGSVVGSLGSAGQANYAASKAAVVAMGRVLASELGSRSITVNCVAPGYIKTDMTKDLPEEQQALFVANSALKRFGTPEEVAAAVSFLASEKAGFITGTTLHVNGGLYMS